MSTTQFLIHILDALKKWLLRFARRSASLLFRFLSLVCRRFAAGHPKLGGWGLATHDNLSGGLLRSQSQNDIARGSAPVCYSLLPTDETVQEVTQEPQFPSDNPYSLRPASAGEADEFKPSSLSSGHRSLQVGDNSVNGFLEGPLQNSSNSGPSSPPGPDDQPRSHLRQGDMDDTHPATPSPASHMRQISLAPSDRSISSRRSVARSITGSDGPQAEYRIHTGPVHPVPVGVSDLDFDRHVHFTAPALPGDDEGVILYGGPTITAMNPNDVRWRRPDILPSTTLNTIVPGMTVVFPAHDAIVPESWTKLVHPAGARYFVNKEKRTFTEVDIRDEEIHGDIEYYMHYLWDELQQVVEYQNIELDMQEVDLVLEPKVFNGSDVVCCYYFANHHDRCLFWLEDYNVENIISDCKRVESLSHIGLAIQAEYWCVLAKKCRFVCKETDVQQRRKHWQHFPSLCPVVQPLVDEVKYMLLRATCDHLNSRVSIAPFDVVELRDYISIVDKINVHFHPDQVSQAYQSHVATILGQIMYEFSRNHFINSHGEDQARLDLKQKVHSYTPSLSMVVFAPLLFLEPMSQVRELHHTFVNAMPSSERSNAFNLELNKQLQETSLLATVLLNANVGFLAINSVDVSGRSPAQIASYMSLVASLGSILLGLLLSHSQIMDPSQARMSLRDHLETLAMIHSFPKALLMWGMVFFFAAFSIHWASRGNASSGTIVGTVILVTLLMILYSITRTRNGEITRTRSGEITHIGNGENRYAGIHLKLSFYLTAAKSRVLGFIRTGRVWRDHTREPQSNTKGVGLVPMDALARSSQADAEPDAPMPRSSHPTNSPNSQSERPGPDHRGDHPNSSTFPEQPTAFVDSPLPLHVSDTMQQSGSHTNPESSST